MIRNTTEQEAAPAIDLFVIKLTAEQKQSLYYIVDRGMNNGTWVEPELSFGTEMRTLLAPPPG